ncbi:MFS family permease [Arthrobacter sp. V4I6]|uniref:MFS transporter n=1 Tax=unclassified Arthrobacter TaxID=235627 RepID=UPI00277DD0D0|nr:MULTISPECIES: MFS transporter [unclassified Arthrobacter]MDQ0822566.1 MFS family permease [Arthrobacter sp. V1I7]MDQ0852194.1 MFS family permease [Arthrobacter sp. V4I6]
MHTEALAAGPKESATRRTIKNLRWWILGWALAAGIINYMDRSAISIAAPQLIKEFGMTRTDIGLLGTVFSWTYAFAQLPAGWLVDKLGARKMYFLAIAGWSIATALMAIGGKMWHFITFRFLLGVTEAPNGPASARLTADWFPRAERGQATAIWDSGSKWGPAIAPPVLTAIMLTFGWQAIFLFLGVAGLVLALAFFMYYRAPEEHKSISAKELDYIESQRTTQVLTAKKVSWLGLFKHRQIWGMMAGFFCVIWIWNIFIVFLPLYLQEERGVSIANSGWLAAVPYLGAAILGITGGWVMTRYSKKAGRDPLLAKRHVMSVAAVIAGILICLIPFVDSLPLALAVMTVALGFVATMQAAAWAMPGDIVDNSQVASVGAIQNFGGYFGGAFAPLLTGVIADATGSYAPSFVIGGIIAALAAVAYTVLVREPIRDKTAATQTESADA